MWILPCIAECNLQPVWHTIAVNHHVAILFHLYSQSWNSCAYLVGRGVPGAPWLCDGQIEILDGVPRRRNWAHIIHVTTGNKLARSNHSLYTFFLHSGEEEHADGGRLPVQPHSQSITDKPWERWHHGHRSFFPVPVQVTTDQITQGLRHAYIQARFV